jgi:transcriptional regulator GlxA family with amidase domain
VIHWGVDELARLKESITRHGGQRLHEARARLLAEPRDVAGVGFAVGYESPSQFSREYRRMFGVPPSHDARALREVAALPSI